MNEEPITLVLTEKSSIKPIKYQKKYKCAYCDHHATRVDLVTHIEEEHEDMIPKGYTPNRVVFNIVNKKETGNCIICRKETKWDEDKCRYDRLCDSKRCHDAYVDFAHKNTNIEEKLKDPEFQNKMLAGRSISGEYKFTDGGKLSYVGSYEKKLLEFMDKFLKIKSKDVLSPGPVIEYEFEGKTHKWITDQYYIPYNLVFDVKDGGSNPNTRQMPEYRAKQKAKEDAIKKQGKYNYIRLTDNNFEQLILIMLELKQSYGESDFKPIVHINEMASPIVTMMPTSYNPNNVYIVNYMTNNVFAGKENHYAVCRDHMTDIFTAHDGEIERIEFDDLVDEADEIKVYKFLGTLPMPYKDLLYNAEEEEDFYRILSNNAECGIEENGWFVEVTSENKIYDAIEECLRSTIMQEKNNICGDIEIPIMDVFDEDGNGEYHRDIDGVFIMNEVTGIRSKSHKSKNEITTEEKKIIYGN